MKMKSVLAAGVASLVLAACTTTPNGQSMANASAPVAEAGNLDEPAALATLIDEVQIPYEKFTLDNGLDVLSLIHI